MLRDLRKYFFLIFIIILFYPVNLLAGIQINKGNIIAAVRTFTIDVEKCRMNYVGNSCEMRFTFPGKTDFDLFVSGTSYQYDIAQGGQGQPSTEYVLIEALIDGYKISFHGANVGGGFHDHMLWDNIDAAVASLPKQQVKALVHTMMTSSEPIRVKGKLEIKVPKKSNLRIQEYQESATRLR